MRRGFTLVELLVVIGIIALLIGILLPVLAGVREAGRNAACLSNLRQVHHALVLYALDANGHVPLGYRRSKQFNSMIYSGTAGAYVLFGKLHEVGLTFEGGVYYCPSEQNPDFQWDVPENPWPPGGEGHEAINTFSGYASRPVVELPDDWGNPPDELRPLRIPRLSQLGNVAILADVMNSPDRLDTRHGDYVNVVWNDASTGRFDRGKMPQAFPYAATDHLGNPVQLGDFTGGGFEELPPPAGWPPDPAWNDEQDAIWAAFDRR